MISLTKYLVLRIHHRHGITGQQRRVNTSDCLPMTHVAHATTLSRSSTRHDSISPTVTLWSADKDISYKECGQGLLIAARWSTTNCCAATLLVSELITGCIVKYINVYRHTEIEGKTDNVAAAETEIFVGDIVRAGIENGLNIHATKVSDHPFLDIGTADDLQSPPHWRLTPSLLDKFSMNNQGLCRLPTHVSTEPPPNRRLYTTHTTL